MYSIEKNEVLVINENEYDETDDYLAYSCSNDDVSLTEPNSEK